MSKAALIIEDRPSRQTKHLSAEQISRMRNIEGVYMPVADECQLIVNELSNKEFLRLCDYTLLIIHKSALSPNAMSGISQFCVENDIALVSFSGGTGHLFYDAKKKVLSSNASSVYTENMIWFLKKYINGDEIPLIALALGKRWKLDQLLQARMIKIRCELETDDYVQIKLKDEYESIIENLEVSEHDIDSAIKKMIYFT